PKSNELQERHIARTAALPEIRADYDAWSVNDLIGLAAPGVRYWGLNNRVISGTPATIIVPLLIACCRGWYGGRACGWRWRGLGPMALVPRRRRARGRPA